MAQRLVRKLCPACRKPYAAPVTLVDDLQLKRFLDGQPIELFKASGCEDCAGSGYAGRTVISEVLILSEELRPMILSRADANTIQRTAIEAGMTTMQEDGLRKAVQGVTSIEEVLRVTQDA